MKDLEIWSRVLCFSQGMKMRHNFNPVSESHLQNKSVQCLAKERIIIPFYLQCPSAPSQIEKLNEVSFSHPGVCGQKQIWGQKRPLHRNSLKI